MKHQTKALNRTKARLAAHIPETQHGTGHQRKAPGSRKKPWPAGKGKTWNK